MLARHGRRLLNLLDDSPVVPGDTHPAFAHAAQARQVLTDAEEDLRDWTPNLEPITSSANEMNPSLMPHQAGTAATSVSGQEEGPLPAAEGSTAGTVESPARRDLSGSSDTAQPEATSSQQA